LTDRSIQDTVPIERSIHWICGFVKGAKGVVEKGATPSPADLLRAALEKIVFFEWRLSEVSAELAAAQSRAAAAEAGRARAEEAAAAAEQRARAARMQASELESERGRLAALLSRPGRGEIDPAALEAERERAARLQASLDEARRDLARAGAERERWLTEMAAQARDSGEAPAALAQFISELRGEIIALRAHKTESEKLLAQAGIQLPALEEPPAAPQVPRESGPIEEARKLWAEGRLGVAERPLPPPSPIVAPTTHFARPATDPRLPVGAAARALLEQSVRHLAARDAARREQAARHLAACPFPGAAPDVAAALGAEQDPKARAQLARALVACGGEGAADIVAGLQASSEHPLVRMAAAEALSAVPSRAQQALAVAAADAAPAVRRRAAALAVSEDVEEVLERLAADEDASVRAAVSAARTEAPPPAAPSQARTLPPAIAEQKTEAPPAKDAAGDVRSAEARSMGIQAVHAVQSAIFGLTDAELAERIGLGESEALELAAQLVAQGKLARRGKRLVFAQGGAA
jgi:hypothetical protein